MGVGWTLDCDPKSVVLTVASDCVAEWEDGKTLRKPDVIKRYKDQASGRTYSTLHWFTEYASLRDQSLQTNGKVWISKEDLRTLIKTIDI